MYIICGGAPDQIQAHIFASFQQKCPDKFFVALGVHLYPLHPSPGYAYEDAYGTDSFNTSYQSSPTSMPCGNNTVLSAIHIHTLIHIH